jgi:hypothetical protein
MTTCPQCKHKEIDGALFCSLCGAQLFEKGSTKPTTNTSEINGPGESYFVPSPLPPPLEGAVAGKITLFLIDTGDKLDISHGEETIIGRITEDQNIIPDIDLTPYNAYEAGVSRLHTHISTIGGHVTAKDLGSTNGTRHNGVQIKPQTEQPLQHGDILTLGRLKIQILINE